MEVRQKVNEKMKVRPLELKRSKEKEKKVVACFAGDYIPLEVIHAAGAEPLTLIFGGAMDAVDASSHALFSYMCPFSRAQYGYYKLKHESPYYNFPDLLIIPTTCTQVLQVEGTDFLNVHFWNYAGQKFFLIYSSQDIFKSMFWFAGISYRRLSPSFGLHLTQPL